MNVFELVAKLTLNSDEFKKGMDESEQKATGFGSKLKSVIGGGTKVAIGGLVAASTAAVSFGSQLVSGVSQIAQFGDNIDKMSQKMGMSRQSYQEWDAVLQHSGTSIEAMKTGMKTLATAAETGSDAFKALGISQNELKSLNQEQLFERTITALQNVEDETQRTYLASKLLGKGGTELGALLNTSAEDTQKMRDRVHELGGVLSDEAVKNAAAFQDSLQDMTTAMSGMKNQLMAEFLPSFKIIMDGLTEIFAGNGGAGVEIVRSGLEAMWTQISEMIPQIGETMKTLTEGMIQMLVEALPEFLDMGFNVINSLIGGIQNNMPAILSTIISIATNMLSILIQRLPEFIGMGLKLIASLVSGVLQATPNILSAIGQLLSQMVSSFMSYDWASLGKNIIDGIVSGLKAAGGAIGNMLMNLAKSAFDGVKKFFGIASPSKLMRDEIGKFIPQGIAVGIEANADSVYKAMDDLSNMTEAAYSPEISSVSVGSAADDSSIISELRSLKNAIMGMNVVLDTGATVGGLAYAMDSELGTITGYKQRGN